MCPVADVHTAIADLVEDVCKKYGGAKSLAGGLVPLSYPQIRRMAADGSIPNVEQVLLFIQLAGPSHPFRLSLVETLVRMFDPTAEEIVAAVEERVGHDAATAVRDVFRQVAPGRWGR